MTLSLEPLKRFFSDKRVRTVAILLAALLLLLAVYAVFSRGEEKSAGPSSETEIRLSELLTAIDDVDEATVMVTEEQGVPVSAVVIFEGKDGILTRNKLLEITANVLRIAKSAILIYPARG